MSAAQWVGLSMVALPLLAGYVALWRVEPFAAKIFTAALVFAVWITAGAFLIAGGA